MPIRLAYLSLVISLALVACSPSPQQRLTSPQSYVVHGQLHLTSKSDSTYGPGRTLLLTQDLVLRVDPGGKTALATTPGRAVPDALASDDGVGFRTTTPLGLPLDYSPCGAGVTYDDFHFTAGPGGLAGSATGTAYLTQGDISFPYSADLDFTGVPDATGPSLAGTGAAVDPLAPLTLTASEALPPDATARLITEGGVLDLVPRLPDGAGAATAFDKPDMALRYGTTYAVALDRWADLAGNPGAAAGEIVTIPPPPVAAEDGFEGAGTSIGGAPVVDATLLPPLDGTRSVLLTGTAVAGVSGTRLTVRLAVAPGDSVVRFTLRPLSPFSYGASTYGTSIKMASPGGAIVRVALPGAEALGTQQALPGGTTVLMGDARTMEAALPAGAADEVVFDFVVASPSGACGLPIPNVGYLLDDLRVE